MLSIWFENKVINFAAAYPPNHQGEGIGEDELGITKVLQKFGNSNTLWVISPLYAELFEKFRSQFIVAKAAGGIVENPAGEVLMILRNGRWDLPKGHKEPGESWEECAEREVGEECGLESLHNKGLVDTTRHTYRLEGYWMLKECRWYAFGYDSGGQPVPQTEEGITEVRWIPLNKIGEKTKTSYNTITGLLNNYLQ